MSDYWSRYDGIFGPAPNQEGYPHRDPYEVAVFTEPLVIEGKLAHDYGDSTIEVAGLDLDEIFKRLAGERVRVTIERLDDVVEAAA